MKYQFKANKGVQGSSSFYTILIPFHVLGLITTINPEVQRKMKPQKVRKLFQYLTENQNDFILPPILLASSGPLSFNDRSGELVIDEAQKLSVIDGQHRRAGVLMLMESELGELYSDNTIAAMIQPNRQTERQADIFSVTNGEQTPVTKAQRELRNYRSKANRVARDVINHLGIADRVAFDQGQVRPGQWFAFTWMVEACRWLIQPLGSTDELNAARLITDYWREVFRVLRPYLGSKEYVASSSAAFIALGQIGKRIITMDQFAEHVQGLAKLNWSRHNGSFEGVFVVQGNYMRGSTAHGKVGTSAQRVFMEAMGLDSAVVPSAPDDLTSDDDQL